MPEQLKRTRLGKIWLMWSHLCGMAVLALGASFLLVQALRVEGDVVKPLGPARDVSNMVAPGGLLSFTIDFERFDSCPGTITETFSSPHAPQFIVIRQRPTLSSEVKVYKDVRVNTQVPNTLSAGRWRYTQTVRSICPTGQHDDPFTEFEFDVGPPG